MEILKEGEKMPSYVFSCERCGCIWRAKEGEYVEIQAREEGMFGPLYRGLFNVYCKCEFIADKGEYSKYYLRMEDVILYTIACPCCSKYVLVRQKPSY